MGKNSGMARPKIADSGNRTAVGTAEMADAIIAKMQVG